MRSRLNAYSGQVREHILVSRMLPNCSERSTRSQPATRTSVRALPLILSSFAGGPKNSRTSDISSLSDRELEIFSFIGRGVSVSELASELHVSVKTIETHQMRMKEKLALHSAAELRQKACEWLAKSAVNRIHEDPESE